MGFNMHIQSQPVREADRWNAYGVSEALAESQGADVGCRPFQIQPDTPNEIRFPLADNTEKVFPLGLPRRNLTLFYTQLDSEEARKVDWMMRNGKAISVGAWFDKHTQWMSHFGGIGRGSDFKGVAEVGLCTNETIIRRDADYADDVMDYAPHVQAGCNAMIGRKQDADGNWLPKIVPGMIGGAALFENGYRCNLATRRYSASAVTSGLQLWQNHSGSGHTDYIVGSAIPNPMAIGSGYSDHIMITPDSSGPSLYPGNRWRETENQTGLSGKHVCISIWARGSGYVTLSWTESNVVKFYDEFLLTEDWAQLTISGLPTATGRVRIHGGGTAEGATYIETIALQIEEGYGPSGSFMDYDAIDGTPVTDCIHIPEAINPHGFTFAFWVKYRDDDDDKVLFAYSPSGTSARMILSIRGVDLILEDTPGSTFEVTDCFLGIDDGEWVQIVMTRRPAENSPAFNLTEFYVNGELSTYFDESAVRATSLIGSDPHLYIGGDGGTWAASAVAGSLNIPLDSARLDSRVWTAAEVLADYELRSDLGMQNFLQMVQGRYFKPAQSYRPQAYRTDWYEGQIELREVDIRRQTVV